MCESTKDVLIIDEVDRTSNNRVFLHFIAMLREKFLARKARRDFTFHSVILAGVYDIKNIKLKMVNEGTYTPTPYEGKIFNSPWNIAANFNVDMSFGPVEIASMLAEYEKDHKTGMDITNISEEIYSYTSGYPFLVSRICQCIDEELECNWTIDGVQQAISLILSEKNTLFDDISKSLGNNRELSELVYDLLIHRSIKPFVIDDPVVDIGAMYGIIQSCDGRVVISNKVFELRIINYYVSKDLRGKKQISGVLQHDVVKGGKFDMELTLRKFSEHYG
jgi:hypothetical protein